MFFDLRNKFSGAKTAFIPLRKRHSECETDDQEPKSVNRGRQKASMSSESSSIIVMVSIIVGTIGAMYLIVKLLVSAGNIHPLICWSISPLYDPGQCLVERAKFDNP